MSEVAIRIRQAVVEIVEAAPAPPPFEDLHRSAAMTEPRPQGSRTRSFLVVARAVVLAAVGLGAWITTRPEDVGRVRTSTSPHGVVLPQRPAAVSGTEQHLTAIPTPDDFTSVLTRRFSRLAEGTTPVAFSVDRSSPLAVAQIMSGDAEKPETRPYLQRMTRGTLPIGGQGLGIGGSLIPMDAIDAGQAATFATWDFPLPGQRPDAWSRLPQGTVWIARTDGPFLTGIRADHPAMVFLGPVIAGCVFGALGGAWVRARSGGRSEPLEVAEGPPS